MERFPSMVRLANAAPDYVVIDGLTMLEHDLAMMDMRLRRGRKAMADRLKCKCGIYSFEVEGQYVSAGKSRHEQHRCTNQQGDVIADDALPDTTAPGFNARVEETKAVALKECVDLLCAIPVASERVAVARAVLVFVGG